MRPGLMRSTLLAAHRWVGLVLAAFLVLAGLTGSLMVWVEELDALASPGLFEAAAPGPAAERLDPLEVRERVQSLYPEARVAMVPLDARPGRALVLRLAPLPGAGPLPNDQVFVDPYTGRILGERRWGDLSQGVRNLVPFLYRLHYSLALGVIGEKLFGIVALLWTIDCFVGAWLTFPPRTAGRGTWLARWRHAWQVRWSGGSYRLNFDLHRAAGLWLWVVLVVIAWSSVAFNLWAEVYDPLMRGAFPNQPGREALAPASQTSVPPALTWHDARRIGRRLMDEQARQHDFRVQRETLLVHDPCCGPRGHYRYQVQSSRDIRDRWGSTQVVFDADTGEFLQLWLPTGAASGDTIRMWLTSLHMAAVGGLPYRLFMTVVGLLVPMLAVTGVVIWARKRRGRSVAADHRASRTGASAEPSGP